MKKIDVVEDRCKNNCGSYEKCVKYALRNRSVRCLYFDKLKKHVDSVAEAFNTAPYVFPITSQEIKIILRRKR